jgi:hypothetical protein
MFLIYIFFGILIALVGTGAILPRAALGNPEK